MDTTQSRRYRVGGMSCDHCRAAITDEVGRVVGVEAVQVDLAAGTVSVQGDRVDPDAVREAIEQAGYEVLP